MPWKAGRSLLLERVAPAEKRMNPSQCPGKRAGHCYVRTYCTGKKQVQHCLNALESGLVIVTTG